MKALRARGVWCFKVHGGPLMPAGLPDIIGVYRGRFVAWETKMPSGRVSVIQALTHERIERAGGIVTVPRSVPEALEALDRIDHPSEENILP